MFKMVMDKSFKLLFPLPDVLVCFLQNNVSFLCSQSTNTAYSTGWLVALVFLCYCVKTK